MSSVGETLRRERLRQELTLEQISRETRISSRLLDAIESDQFHRLPGGVFAKSFVRQYAHYLSLDADDLAAEVQRMLEPEPEPGASAPPEPAFRLPKMSSFDSGGSRSNSSVLPALAMVVAVMLLCSGIYTLWQRSRRPAPVPAPRPAAAVQPETPPQPKAAEPAPATPVVANNGESTPKTEVAEASATPSGTAQAPVPAITTETPAEPVDPNPAAPLHVSLTADSDTWVQAWADGKSVLIATLRPGKVKIVAANEEIRLRTGNAGSLLVTFNGKPAGPIGPKGQIRNVVITSEGLQILAPPPKPEPEPGPAPAPEPL